MPDTPAVPPSSTEDETQVLPPTAAHRAWSSPELRSMIIDHMAKEDIVKVLCLDQTAFKDMAKSLYRSFHFKDYDRSLSPIIPYTRRKLYIESVRELDLEGATPLLRNINGYSHLLDLLPLVVRITASNVESVTPSRQMENDGSPASMVTSYIKYHTDATDHLKSADRNPPRPWEACSAVLRAFPNCQFIYDIEVENAHDLDCDISPWDLAAASEGRSSLDSSLESRARKILDERDNDKRFPMAAMLCRQIRSLNLDLDDKCYLMRELSTHLDRRREIGYDEISSMTVRRCVSYIDMIPDFLRRHQSLRAFACFDKWGYATSLSHLLLGKWDREESVGVNSSLRHLSLDFDFGEWPRWSHDHEDLEQLAKCLDETLRRRSSLPTFARLETLTLMFDTCFQGWREDPGQPTSPPNFAKIAEGLVQIGGAHFELEFENLKPSAKRDRCHEMLRSLLKTAVVARQKIVREEESRNV